MPPPNAPDSSANPKVDQTSSTQKQDRTTHLQDWRKAATFACKRGLICCTVDASERVEEETEEIKGFFNAKSITISVNFETHRRSVSVDLGVQEGDKREGKNIFPKGPLSFKGDKGISCSHADRVAREVREYGLEDFVPPLPTIPLHELLPINPAKPEPLSQIIQKAKKIFPIEAEREKKVQRAAAIKKAKKFWDMESDEKKPSYSRGFFAGMAFFRKQCDQQLRATRDFTSANRLPDKYPNTKYTAETPIPFEYLPPATKRKITLSITNPKSPKKVTKRLRKKAKKGRRKQMPASILMKEKLLFLPTIPLTRVQVPDKSIDDMAMEVSIVDKEEDRSVENGRQVSNDEEMVCSNEEVSDDSTDAYDFSAEGGYTTDDESEEEPESIPYFIPTPPLSVAYSSAPSVAGFEDVGSVAETEQEKEYRGIIDGLFVDNMNAVFNQVEEFMKSLP
jgi:hypothetical protein